MWLVMDANSPCREVQPIRNDYRRQYETVSKFSLPSLYVRSSMVRRQFKAIVTRSVLPFVSELRRTVSFASLIFFNLPLRLLLSTLNQLAVFTLYLGFEREPRFLSSK